jgi:predicted RNA-binding protein
VGQVERVEIADLRSQRLAATQTAPPFCNHDGILGVSLLIANGARKAAAHLGEVDQFRQFRDVLGALVVDATDAVLEEQHVQRAAVFGLHFSPIEKGAVDNAA